jgi:hypothetical protein
MWSPFFFSRWSQYYVVGSVRLHGFIWAINGQTKLMWWLCGWLAGMAYNETAACWNSTGQCISVSFHICMSSLPWTEHSWEPPNADGLWSCLVQTVNSEACQGQLKDIQVPLLSIGNHIFSMSTNLFLTQKVMLVLWTSIGIIVRDTEIEPLACSVQNSWGSIVDGSDVHIGTPWPVYCVKWVSVCDVA